MRQSGEVRVSKGHTLLVKGPASVKLYEGGAHTYLAELDPQRTFVVPEGRRIPIEAIGDSSLRINVGSSGSVEEVEGPSIPEGWMNAISTIKRSHGCNRTVFIMGEVDSGKNSLATLLANYIIRHEPSVSILDLDVGQTEISFPASIALGETAKPIHGLYEVRSKAAYFIGTISPSLAADRIIHCAQKLIDKRPPNRSLIVNTDGWIEDESAQAYKRSLLRVIKPDHVILIGEGAHYSSILDEPAQGAGISWLERPPLAYRRTREERRRLRESAYRRLLREGSVKEFPLSKLKWEPIDVAKTLRGEVNLLSGLLGPDGLVAGLGVLKKVDPPKGVARIFTSASRTLVEGIEVGLVRIGEDGRELDPASKGYFRYLPASRQYSIRDRPPKA